MTKPNIYPIYSLKTENERTLFEGLKDLRLKIAKKVNLPAYCVFHDKTLHELIEEMPQSLEEMELINGIGAVKLDKYGKLFLNVILGKSIEDHSFFEKGLDEEIAISDTKSTSMNESSISTEKINISGNLKDRIKTLPITKSNDKIKDQRILETRKELPRAYEPWSSKEDTLLKKAYKENGNIKELASLFQRQEGAIKSRLEKKMNVSDLKKNSSNRDAILKLLRETNFPSAEIAEKVGVSPPTVWAYKGQLTMGTYDKKKVADDE